MTYPPYGGQENYGGYRPGPPSGDLPAQRFPTSGPFPAQPPSYGLPSTQQPPPPPPAKNRTVTILSIAVVVLVVVAGLFTVLYIMESGSHNDTAATLQTKERELNDANNGRKSTQAKLDETDGSLKDAEKARDEAKDQVTELTKCRDAAKAFMDAVAANKADVGAEVRDMIELCK
jgi:uncharacterized protein HemX